MDVHRQVLAPTECSTDAAERQPHHRRWQAQGRRHLGLVEVEPLRSDVEVDAAVAVGDGEPRLGTEERRVLRSDLEVRLDHDLGSPARLVRVTVADAHVAHEVAAGMHGTAVAGEGELGVDDGLQLLVHHDDLVERATGDLGMVGGDDGDGLALVAHLVEGEHGLIGDLHAVRLLAGNVLVGEHCGHARDAPVPASCPG